MNCTINMYSTVCTNMYMQPEHTNEMRTARERGEFARKIGQSGGG
jgi:hypothetical protein